MKEQPHTTTKDRLSQYRQISTLVYHMLQVAGAGGLPEEEAKAMYHKILDGYSTLNGEAFWLFKDELIRMLVTPDAHFEKGDDENEWILPGRN